MRLWQKIFLLTLILTLLAVNAVSFVLLLRSQRSSLILAKEKAQAVCETAVLELERSIQDEKERTDYFLLTEQDIMDLLSAEINKSALGCEVRVNPGVSADYYQMALINDDYGEHLIQVGTSVFWEGHFYRVTVDSNVEELFEQFVRDLTFSRWFGGGVALIIAVLLLVSSLMLTRPLKRLETATERIANGEYSERIIVKGSGEIAELSEHMNIMSAEIEANINRIEQISSSRETFIENMTHELKTPLTSILGFADILTIKSDMTEDERREYASIIAAEAKRLRLLSSKLMELVALNETELELHPVNLKELIERAVEAFSPICAGRQCSICAKLEPVVIDADNALFTSLVLNLLDNALKASSPGQYIDICAEKKDGEAILHVKDSGIGIPEDQLAHVTEAFYMVDKSRSRSAGGAGIGLSLCKAIAEAHRGTLEIESAENCGTTVLLTVPVPKEGGK